MSIILPLNVIDISGNKVPGHNVMVLPRSSTGIALADGLFYQGGFNIPEKILKNCHTYIRIV
jgi:hypothetical protein